MDPFVGEIRLFPYTFAPQDWALCNGQLLRLNQSIGLFALLGTTFGGDGRTTFGLPNLQGRVMLGAGLGTGLSNHALGQTGGSTTVALTPANLPPHTHNLAAVSTNGTTVTSSSDEFAAAAAGVRGQQIDGRVYASGTPSTALAPTALAGAGGGGAHNNMQPYVVMNYFIALQGVYPQRP